MIKYKNKETFLDHFSVNKCGLPLLRHFGATTVPKFFRLELIFLIWSNEISIFFTMCLCSVPWRNLISITSCWIWDSMGDISIILNVHKWGEDYHWKTCCKKLNFGYSRWKKKAIMLTKTKIYRILYTIIILKIHK